MIKREKHLNVLTGSRRMTRVLSCALAMACATRRVILDGQNLVTRPSLQVTAEALLVTVYLLRGGGRRLPWKKLKNSKTLFFWDSDRTFALLQMSQPGFFCDPSLLIAYFSV